MALLHFVQTGCEAHSASCPLGIKVPCPGVYQSGREFDDSPSSSVVFKNVWNYITTTPQYIIPVVFLIKKWKHLFIYLSMALQPFCWILGAFQFLDLFRSR
jgi:hypothetical protein